MLCYYYTAIHYSIGQTQRWRDGEVKGEVLLRGVGTLRYLFPPNASVQWQPDGLIIHANKWFLGAGFLGAPPISLMSRRVCRAARAASARGAPTSIQDNIL